MIDFSFKLIGHGWIEAFLIDGEKKTKITASYLSDAPYDLIIAITLLCEGVNETICSWQDEPGGNQWIFKRENNCFELKVIEFEQAFSNSINENTHIAFLGNENLIKFAHRILREFNAIKSEYSTDDYKNLWGYEFPLQALNRLRIAAKTIKG